MVSLLFGHFDDFLSVVHTQDFKFSCLDFDHLVNSFVNWFSGSASELESKDLASICRLFSTWRHCIYNINQPTKSGVQLRN